MQYKAKYIYLYIHKSTLSKNSIQYVTLWKKDILFIPMTIIPLIYLLTYASGREEFL